MMRDLRSRGQAGFTLVELLTTLLLASILVTLGAFAFRHYWFVQSLEGGENELINQLRGLQQRVVSESFPLVYGARFVPGSSRWVHVQYDPDTTNCTVVRDADFRSGVFNAGVEIEAADFDTYSSGGINVSSRCRLGIGSAEVVFFFARGTATTGEVTIVQPRLDGRTKKVCVAGLTGRVESDEVASC